MNLPNVEEAISDPTGYQVSYDMLGWSLQYVESSNALLISAADADKVIDALDAARVKKSNDDCHSE